MIIAIDGPSAAGKGTLSQRLAKEFNYSFFDTGRLYRAVAYLLLEAGKNPDSEEEALKIAKSLKPETINSVLKNPLLRKEEVGKGASKVAQIQTVRAVLLDFQRRFAEKPFFEDGGVAKGAILDGRDIGTVVCPNADVKLFVTASVDVRAERRFKELVDKGENPEFEKILTDMKERDERDTKRAASPLMPAKDAHILDTSDMNAEQAFQAALAVIAKNSKKKA